MDLNMVLEKNLTVLAGDSHSPCHSAEHPGTVREISGVDIVLHWGQQICQKYMAHSTMAPL